MSKSSYDNIAYVLGILTVIVAIMVVGPLVTIWALNTLFPILSIPYDFSTWFAIVVLTTLLRARVENKMS
jgi:hypothetical protein